MTDLTTELHALAADVDWPPTPDLTASVLARVDETGPTAMPRRRRRVRARRRVVIVISLLVLALPAAALAVPATRHTILDAFGLRHVTVERPSTFPHAARDPELGRRIALPHHALVPRALGPPAATYRNGKVITLVYDRPRLLLAQARGRLPNAPVLSKILHMDDRARRTTVDGAPALFLGTPHAYLWSDVTGAPVRSGPALIWERGTTVLRLEGEADLARARAIAASVS